MSPSQPHLDTGFLVNRLARLLRTTFAVELAPLGLTPQQAAVLLGLSATGESSLSEIAERIGVDRATMSGLASRLERDGWVVCREHPTDGRSRLLALTERGQATVPELGDASRAVDSQTLTGFSADDKRTLAGLLGRAISNHEEGAA